MQSRVRTKLNTENFLIDLSDLLRAGIDVDFALGVLSEQSGLHKVVARELREHLRSGSSISNAFTAVQFPKHIVRFVHIAELTGELDIVLQRVSELLSKQRMRREKFFKMLSYPTLVLLLSIGVLYILAAMVMPSFEQMYRSMHLMLTPSTMYIFELSHAMVIGVPVLISFLVISGVFFLVFWKRISKSVLHILLFYSLSRSIIQVWKGRETMEILSFLLSAGIDLLSSLHVLEEIDAGHMALYWRQVISSLKEGKTFSVALSIVPYLPSLVCEMIALAETTGNLEQTSTRLYIHLERMIDRKMERSLRIIEPSLTIGLGLVVGGATLFLMLPMLAMVKQLS